MTPFEYLSVALSFVSGLAVAIVLTSAVRAFRARRRIQLDWVPFVWAVCILLVQFQTWWAMLGYRSIDEWTFGRFGLLILQMVTLFVASALVLPGDSGDYPDSLRSYFEEDGRWSVAAMGVQITLAVITNVYVASVSVFQPFHVFHVILFALCLTLLRSSSRTVTAVTTILFALGVTAAMAVTHASMAFS